MRPLSKFELEKLKILTENSIELCLIEPTETGLKKSIMDATGPVRSFLKEAQVHDYDQQLQGPENKIMYPAFLIKQDLLLPSAASLYRPNTKKGDPRIWFKNLGGLCAPNDILGIFHHNNSLFVFNLTRLDIHQLLSIHSDNPLKDIVAEIRRTSNQVADELLMMLRKIASRGPIPAMVNADTSIGRTLETLLGIDINSSKQPDYKGIELKSYRDKRGNRKNLFAQVPDWPISKFKSSAEILNAFGYQRDTDFKLYCTVSAIVRNSQGLMLRVDSEEQKLFENESSTGDFIVWKLETLHRRLIEKHSETFWIAADSIQIDGKEHFQYKTVEHTKKPIVSQFDILVEQGIITLDHLIKRKSTGSVVEKGPIFKIKPNALDMLFPPSSIINLIE